MTYTGFHAVEERVRRYALQKDDAVLTIYYSKPGPRIKKIIAQAQKALVQCVQCDEKKLDTLVQNLSEQQKDHRGIVLVCEGEKTQSANLTDFDRWVSIAREKATVIILDGVTDPHNIGAVLRSCDQFGADLLITAAHNSTANITQNEVIARTSAGASSYVPLSVVTNLARTVQALKQNGFWIYGADAGGTSLAQTSFDKKTAIIMGSEGSGMSRLIQKECDTIVSIPTCGKIDSLNVSVAAGVLLYERHRQDLQCSQNS